MRPHTTFSALILTSLLAAGASVGHAADLSKAEVEAIVHDYIATHGDVVLESVNTYQQKRQADAAKHIIHDYSPVQGPATAPITIIEFADFECPFCYKVEPTILNLQKRYAGKIRWVYKYLPLEFHKNAMPAAQAAAAAQNQGKFWEFAKQLFVHQDQLGDKLYADTAKSLKLDMKKFDADRNSVEVRAHITQDLQDAAAVEAHGTPFFLINGQALSGALPTEEFTKVIDAQLAKK